MSKKSRIEGQNKFKCYAHFTILRVTLGTVLKSRGKKLRLLDLYYFVLYMYLLSDFID